MEAPVTNKLRGRSFEVCSCCQDIKGGAYADKGRIHSSEIKIVVRLKDGTDKEYSYYLCSACLRQHHPEVWLRYEGRLV